ncbi:MAG: hypothetical protein ABJF50_11430 [Paracoccaceae bacterium]
MIATFVFAALATWGAPQLEPQLKALVGRLLPLDDVSAVEMRGITIAVLLFVAAVLASLLGSHSTLALGVGAVVGVLGPRGYQRLKQSRAPDYDS